MNMKMTFTTLTAASIVSAGAVVAAPAAHAECGNAVVWGNGGGQCDGPFYADGSFQRCVQVYVMGIGGSNCYIVPPP